MRSLYFLLISLLAAAASCPTLVAQETAPKPAAPDKLPTFKTPVPAASQQEPPTPQTPPTLPATKSELSDEAGTLKMDSFPKRYQFLLIEAMKRFQIRDFKGALEYVDKADEVLAPTAWSLNIRGAIAIELHDFERGLKFCKDALKLEPNFFPAKFNICEIPFLQGQYAEARKLWSQIYAGMKIGDSSAELVIYRIFLTFLLEKDMTQARDWMEKIPFPSQTPAYQFAQAAWARQKGDLTKWDEWMRSANYIWPEMKRAEFVDVMIQLGWVKRE
jgi:tetratricopeptide (TPR) repeat protein